MPDTAPSRPLLGAALTLDHLPAHRDWLFERQRDLELQDFFMPEVLDGDWRPLAAAARRALDGYAGRLGLHGPFWGFSIASVDPEIRAVVRRRLLQGLEIAEAVAATQMVIHSPYTTWDGFNLDERPGSREAVVARTHATLEAVVRRAEDIGCELVIENIEDREPAARVALAASFGSPRVQVSVDTGHAHYAHVSTGAPPVDYFIHAAGQALRHVHIQDVDGHADRHWAPGEGTVPWGAVFQAIARSCDRPRLLIELDDQTKVLAGAAHLVALGLAE